MAATTDQIIQLGKDSAFRDRIAVLVGQIVAQIYGEDPGTAGHSARVAFAIKVEQTPGYAQNIIAPFIADRTNIVGSNVTFNFADGHVVTDASDAAILSQLATDWNLLAGI